MNIRSNTLLMALLAAIAPATAADWVVDSTESSLSFVAVQQGASFRGSFTEFAPQIRFDPQQPDAGQIDARITTASVDTQNRERDEYLLGEDWFDAGRWPEAVFASQSIEANSDGGYTATGMLTLRDQTREVRMPFRFEPDGESWRLQGEVELKRLAFGVGQGLWTNTDWVGDDVRIEIDLRLTTAP